ncbi:MAG: hypothetical protein J6X70_01020 [Muribaculaceae bacterium]|nr:hypothetical protein [Muribaculaceae bacterium]
MTLLNVSFGIFAFLPQGWLFMLLVIVIEAIAMSRFLAKKTFNIPIFCTALFSNIVSGAVGITASLMLNGGWWLVVWFPWVSSHEVDGSSPQAMLSLTAYYLLALIGSVLIEGLLNTLLLQRHYGKRETIKATLIANAITYALGAFLIGLLVYL